MFPPLAHTLLIHLTFYNFSWVHPKACVRLKRKIVLKWLLSNDINNYYHPDMQCWGGTHIWVESRSLFRCVTCRTGQAGWLRYCHRRKLGVYMFDRMEETLTKLIPRKSFTCDEAPQQAAQCAAAYLSVLKRYKTINKYCAFFFSLVTMNTPTHLFIRWHIVTLLNCTGTVFWMTRW